MYFWNLECREFQEKNRFESYIMICFEQLLVGGFDFMGLVFFRSGSFERKLEKREFLLVFYVYFVFSFILCGLEDVQRGYLFDIFNKYIVEGGF